MQIDGSGGRHSFPCWKGPDPNGVGQGKGHSRVELPAWNNNTRTTELTSVGIRPNTKDEYK